MEYGIHVHDASPLPPDPRDACTASWRAILPSGPLRAIYFGSEFCADLLPGKAEVKRLCGHARDVGVAAVLLTPIASPGGFARIGKLLAGVAQMEEAPAVVFNDWGVGNLLRESFPHLQRRAGRLMNRGLRDPRLMEQMPENPKPAAALEGDRGQRLRALLAGFGVTALETDSDIDGNYLGNGTEGLQRVLYLPYAFAASSRNCLVKAEEAGSEDECFTKGLELSCKGSCRGRWHRVDRSDTQLPLWRAGNTVFFEVPQYRVETLIRHADRIVLHERPTP
ncbi:MAG: hypothetical protein WC100_11030 [Sterolibacterium sp.]